MENQFKIVYNILVDTYGRYYNGETINFKKVCDLIKEQLEEKSLLGQNVNQCPIEYYMELEVIVDSESTIE